MKISTTLPERCLVYEAAQRVADVLGARDADVLAVRTSIELGWRDRVRLLLRGHIEVYVRVACERTPGRTAVVETHVHVTPVWEAPAPPLTNPPEGT